MFSNSRSSLENGSKSLSHMLNDTSMLREVCKIVCVLDGQATRRYWSRTFAYINVNMYVYINIYR